MSPGLATFLTLAAILLLLRSERRRDADASAALWLPVMWLAVTGSRFVSQWMALGEGHDHNYTEGSLVDALYFFILICGGLSVLAHRSVALGTVVRNNLWLALFIGFGFLSIVWSDEPVIAFKRWVKTMGHPVMALVILTDPRPADALRTVLRRCAYLLLPLSVLFIKYYPDVGRSYDPWSGEAHDHGVGLTKNDLGYTSMTFAIFLFWELVTLGRTPEGKRRWLQLAPTAALLCAAVWLLLKSNSATSLAGFLLGSATIYLLGTRLVSKRHFGFLVIFVVVLVVGAEAEFDLYASTLKWLGRSPTLTDRTLLWEDVLAMQDRSILGFGFESFWLGSRLDLLWAKWWWKPVQAHNGYIETYLNLGAIGVLLLLAVIVSSFRRISAAFEADLDFARLRMGLLFAILAFNYAEAAFKGVHFMWTIFFIVALHCPGTTASDASRQAAHRPLPAT